MENEKTKETYKKVYINNLIALCHILDNYAEFSKNLVSLISTKYNRNDVYYLYQISNGKFVFGAKKVKQFYQKNKTVVDTINKYSNISNFINRTYDFQGNLWKDSSLDLFYKYMLDHKENIEKILSILSRLKSLEFDELKFDEDRDFTNTEYKVDTVFGSNFEIEYVDNIEIIPNYPNDIVKYKTSYSNYKIKLDLYHPTVDRNEFFSKEIIVNSLLFDEKRLPKSLTKESTFDKIISLYNNKKAECSAIENSVNLSIDIDSLISSFISTDNLISKLDDIENKDELLQILIEIQVNLGKLKTISSSYNNSLSKKYAIPQETFEQEKQKYLKRVYDSSIDLD